MSQTETILERSHLQSHTVNADRRSRLSSVPEPIGCARDYRPAIASLLLGLKYRSFLTPSEQVLLDELTDQHSISFLIRGRTYLHPADVELFPFEEIQSAIGSPSGCVFSQTWRSTSDGRGTYALMTVSLGEIAYNRMIFGMLIPLGLRRDQAAISRFHEIARQFDEASQIVARTSTQIDNHISRNDPFLIVNRASGRVIAVSDSAADLLKSDSGKLLDLEFGQLKPQVTPLLGQTALTMTSLGENALPICLIRFESRPARVGREDLAAFLVHKMRNKVSSIYTAASYLQTTTCWKCESDEADLAQLIQSEITELDQQLQRFHLMLGYNQMNKLQVNLADAAAVCIEQVRISRSGIRAVRVNWQASPVVISAPNGAVEHLLESIIQSHTQDYVEPAEIDITAADDGDQVRVTVCTALENHKRPAIFASGWASLGDCLATLMDAQLHHRVDHNCQTLTSELIIPLRNK